MVGSPTSLRFIAATNSSIVDGRMSRSRQMAELRQDAKVELRRVHVLGLARERHLHVGVDPLLRERVQALRAAWREILAKRESRA